MLLAPGGNGNTHDKRTSKISDNDKSPYNHRKFQKST